MSAQHASRGFGFSLVALVAMGVQVIAGGMLLALIVVAEPRTSDAIGMVLKALAVALYVGTIALAVRAWTRGSWTIAAAPLLTVAAMLAITVVGNAIVSWTFPVGPAP